MVRPLYEYLAFLIYFFLDFGGGGCSFVLFFNLLISFSPFLVY